MERVNVGIVGLGQAGTQLHARAYSRIPSACLHALCSRDPQKLARAAHEFGVERTYTDYDDFLRDDGLEAVSICVTDPLHVEFARKAVEAGRHVMCEKPLGTTLEDVRGLVRLVRARGVCFAVGQVYRFVPQFNAVRAMLRAGRLGRLFHIDCDYQQDMRTLYRATPWRRDDKTWNSWIAGGSHAVDLVRYVAGDVEQVMMYGTKGEEDPACGPPEDSHLAIMKLKGGATCKVWEVRCIKRAPEFTITLGVYGGRGTALGSLVEEEIRFFSLDDGEAQTAFGSLRPGTAEGIPIREELEDFVCSIREGREPRCGVADGARTIATLLAALESQAVCRPVQVPDVE